jgi:hypothetical protein
VTARLRRGGAVEELFTVETAGEAWAALTLAAPGTSWGRGDTAVGLLEVDGRDAQHIILAGGEEPVEYARMLGRLEAGPHRLALRVDEELSAPAARTLECAAIAVRTVADEDPAAFVWRHAPILHYRALGRAPDALTTDAPLVTFYRRTASLEGRGIEYHVINSHEDGGTDLPRLLACWGHTTDIEWVFRIVRDACGRIVREEFQGPGHVTAPFRGGRAFGGHPVLQVATRNGMVADRVTSPWRTAPAPLTAQPEDEPREGVQFRFPWIYRASALEVARQERLEAEPRTAGPDPADLRAYVYVQVKRPAAAAGIPLEALALVRGTWVGSAWGRVEFAFRDEDAESTAIKLPAGRGQGDVEALALRALEPADRDVSIRFVRAFCLDQDYRPRPPFAGPAVCTLAVGSRHAEVWRR